MCISVLPIMNSKTLVFIGREKPNEIRTRLKTWGKQSINGKNNGSRSREKLGENRNIKTDKNGH